MRGSNIKVYVNKETSFNTENTVAKYKMPVKSFSVNESKEMVESEALLGLLGTVDEQEVKRMVEGSMELEYFPSIAGVVFDLGLGKSTLDTDKTLIEPDYTLPSFTILANLDGNLFNYTGVKVNTLSFSGSVDGIPSITLDVLGVKEIMGATQDTATQVDTGTQPFYITEMTISQDGTTFDVNDYSSISFDINRNLNGDDFGINGVQIYRKTIEEGKMELTGSADFNFDISKYTEYKNNVEFSLFIKLERDGKSITIKLPRLKWTSLPHDVSDAGTVKVTGEFKGLIDATDGLIKVTDTFNATGDYWS